MRAIDSVMTARIGIDRDKVMIDAGCMSRHVGEAGRYERSVMMKVWAGCMSGGMRWAITGKRVMRIGMTGGSRATCTGVDGDDYDDASGGRCCVDDVDGRAVSCRWYEVTSATMAMICKATKADDDDAMMGGAR